MGLPLPRRSRTAPRSSLVPTRWRPRLREHAADASRRGLSFSLVPAATVETPPPSARPTYDGPGDRNTGPVHGADPPLRGRTGRVRPLARADRQDADRF